MIEKGIRNPTAHTDNGLEQTDLKKMELDEDDRLRKEYGEKISNYFMELILNFDEINGFSQEKLYSLKRFLIADNLSKTELCTILETTEFRISYKNVSERMDDFVRLRLIEKSGQSLQPSMDNRKITYKLTSVGLFWAVLKLEEHDCGDPFELEEKNINIFEVYEKDFLIENFIFGLLDKKLLDKSSIGNDNLIKLLFYLKSICQEFFKELKDFKILQETGRIQKPRLKWPYSLKNDSTKWNEFCNSLMGDILRGDTPESIDDIKDPIISDSYLSFILYDKVYSIEIVRQDKKRAEAVLNIDNKQYDVVTSEILPHCYILYKTKFYDFDENYLYFLGMRIESLVKSLRIRFVMDVLEFFDKYNTVRYSKDDNGMLSIVNYQMITIARDEKIKKLIEEIRNQINERYQELKSAIK